MKPILYIAATPIGSLHDASPHLIETLQNADLILCEDTRQTQKLLQALKIGHKTLESLHVHNEQLKSRTIIEHILERRLNHIVLVSDAGTPAISDPGAHFVALAHTHKFEIRNIPGPSSFACAMASHGFLQPQTVFVGFLPRTKPQQVEEFKNWIMFAPSVIIFFESPKRILHTLKNLAHVFKPQIQIALSREVSKKFEENLVMSLSDAILHLSAQKEIRGEFVVSIEIVKDAILSISHESEKQDIAQKTLKEDCKNFSKKYGLSAKHLYQYIIETKNKSSL